MRTSASAALLLAAVVCAGCPRRPTPTAAARPIQIPAGCEADLSGTYTFKGRDEWRYLARDDGGTLVLQLLSTSPDGGVGAGAPPNRTSIVLERTPDGFVGAARAEVWPTQSVACSVSFPTEVAACRDAGLVLRTADAIGVDESCRIAPASAVPMREVELLRLIIDRG